jgi:hypothetical protein
LCLRSGIQRTQKHWFVPHKEAEKSFCTGKRDYPEKRPHPPIFTLHKQFDPRMKCSIIPFE